EEIEAALLTPLNKQISTLRVPLYNRLLRRADKDYQIEITQTDIIVVEGVVALMLNLASSRRTVRVFISRRESDRYACLAADYKTRGLSAGDFQDLYAQRQKNETPYILPARERADIVIETP